MNDDTIQQCAVDGCAGSPFSRRLCRPHYMHFRRLGQLERFPKRRPGPKSWGETPNESERRRYHEGRRGQNATHGTRERYSKGGCRCDPCRLEGNRAKREQYAARKAAGLRHSTGKIENECQTCGKTFNDRRARVYCSMECYRKAQGLAPVHSWWINKGWRYKIYERDGWRCQLCGEPVDMCAPPSGRLSPTLDHITPRAHGGSDDPENLRLAHRVCNSSRGSRSSE